MNLGYYNPAANKAYFESKSLEDLKNYVRVNPHCSIVKKVSKRKNHFGFEIIPLDKLEYNN